MIGFSYAARNGRRDMWRDRSGKESRRVLRWTAPPNVRSAASANTPPKAPPSPLPSTKSPPPALPWNSEPTAATGATPGTLRKKQKISAMTEADHASPIRSNNLRNRVPVALYALTCPGCGSIIRLSSGEPATLFPSHSLSDLPLLS